MLFSTVDVSELAQTQSIVLAVRLLIFITTLADGQAYASLNLWLNNW